MEIMENKKQAIILLGAPGSGKGTQANLVGEKLGLYHLETSKLLEQEFNNPKQGFVEIKGNKYFFKKERELWETGKLCSLPFVFFLIERKIKELTKEARGIVFTGSPRKVTEAEILIPFLEEIYGRDNLKILFLELSLEQSVWRNSHRKICQLMRHSILYNEETAKLKLCPLDGSKLIKRELDRPEIIEKRFKVFEQETLPIIDHLEKNNFTVGRINGEQSVANVFSDILRKL